MPATRLARAVGAVVGSGNCSGCGACALISERLRMALAEDGFARPVVDDSRPGRRGEAAEFRRTCPGERLTAPALTTGSERHPTFGIHRSAWRAWAADEQVRRAGSSAGVLTALSTWILESGTAPSVVAAAAGNPPARTVSVRITTREEALAAAGSRYAPVGVAGGAGGDFAGQAVVGKPCEVSALSQLAAARGIPRTAPLLSFFCAGTPSQHATDRLIRSLGVDMDTMTGLRYRGDGWPGEFVATDASGRSGRLSYEQSWGEHLGRALQWRCKICPDGTGEHADLSVGDFWEADDRGFPLFTESAGSSVIIVRTEIGARLLQDAVAAGRVLIEPVDLAAVERVQPLQRERRREVGGRLIGRLLAGRSIPRYRGYGLLRNLLERPRQNLRAARGTRQRSTEG